MLRKLIPFLLCQGWCKFYEFSDGDLRAGQELLARLHERAGAASGGIDWDLVHGLCESAIYGGRVDDAHDIKILRSYLEASFNQSVASGGGGLVGFDSLPSEPDVRKYLDLVGRMPEEDKPSTFGLPANIERSHQRGSSAATIAQLRTLARSLSAGSKFEREKWQKELTPVLTLWKRLNQGSNLLQAKLHPPAGEGSGGESSSDPVKAFVELERFNAISLLQHVHKSLSGLSRYFFTFYSQFPTQKYII